MVYLQISFVGRQEHYIHTAHLNQLYNLHIMKNVCKENMSKLLLVNVLLKFFVLFQLL